MGKFGEVLKVMEGTTEAIPVVSDEVVYTNSFLVKRAEYFGLWYKAATSPDLKIELEMSYKKPTTENAADATYWTVPEGVGNIETNLVATTPKVKTISPAPMKYARFKITGNVGNGASATITMLLFMQEE